MESIGPQHGFVKYIIPSERYRSEPAALGQPVLEERIREDGPGPGHPRLRLADQARERPVDAPLPQSEKPQRLLRVEASRRDGERDGHALLVHRQRLPACAQSGLRDRESRLARVDESGLVGDGPLRYELPEMV